MSRMLLLLAWLLLTGCEFHSVSALNADDEAASRAGNVTAVADYEAALTTLLADVVSREGLVDYDALRGPRNEDLRRVLKAIEDFDPTQLRTDAQKMAFWMNAYNVQMLQHIVEHPAVQNIVDDGLAGTFFQTPYRTAGLSMSLDDLENVILRREDGPAPLVALRVDQLDPRLHVGLNCAAISCPRLRQRAFTVATLEAELETAMRDFVNGSAHFRAEGETVVLSSLLDWFGPDFDRPEAVAGDYLLSFMDSGRADYAALSATLGGRSSAALRNQPEVRYEYLWEVNAAP
ncbi:MAG: DUF547 domain-containing protein [Bacteroidota bacterium]